jgi:hypothetical protein
VFRQLNASWTEFVENEAKTWAEFHRYWLSKRSEVSLLIVRYEDLVQNQEVC